MNFNSVFPPQMLHVMIKKVFGYFETIRNRFITIEEQARRAGVTMGKNNMVSSRFWEFAEPYLIEVGNNCQITGGGKILYTRWGWCCKTLIS